MVKFASLPVPVIMPFVKHIDCLPASHDPGSNNRIKE